MSASMPYLAIAASVSPPPAMLKAGLAAIARANSLGALGERRRTRTRPTGPVPDDRAGRLQLIGQQRGGARADVEDQVVGGHVGRPP
jgi:hypothetical protein